MIKKCNGNYAETDADEYVEHVVEIWNEFIHQMTQLDMFQR
jgi:hypothetical protein